MKYYSRMRPVSPGTYPRGGVSEIVNFDYKQLCEEIQTEAWGYIEYDRELSQKEVEDYELTPAGTKTWWGVTTMFYDDGKVSAAVTGTQQSAVQPDSSQRAGRNKDVYLDWFDSREEADEFVEEAKRA